MKKQYRSPLVASIHETAEDLHNGGLMNKHTMSEFDELCLTPVPTVFALPVRTWAAFVARLDAPAKPNPRLRRTMKTPALWD
jgi:putative transcriptional regulator